jgi:site-specific DNA recombinase
MYIASVFSQLERETIAERIKDNMMQLAKTGRWLGGVPPTGFKSEVVITKDLSGKERKMYKLVPVTEEIELVKLIYNKYIYFKSISKVEKYLIENKISTKNGVDFQRYSIKFILSNPVYSVADMLLFEYLTANGYDVCSEKVEFSGSNGLTGYNRTIQGKENSASRYRDSNEWILAVGMHEGIITSQDWIKAQNLLNQNKSKAYRKVKSTQSLLSGILRCAKCGSFMRPKAVNRLNSCGEQVFYYMCEMKEKSRKTRCDITNINGNILDNCVLQELKKIDFDNSLFFGKIDGKNTLVDETKSSIQTEIDILKNKVFEADLGIKNILAAIQKGQPDQILSSIVERMQELITEKEYMQKALIEKQESEKVAELSGVELEKLAQSLGRLDECSWDIMDVKTKREMIKSIVEKIFWDGEKLDIMLFGSKCMENLEKGSDLPSGNVKNAEMFP